MMAAGSADIQAFLHFLGEEHLTANRAFDPQIVGNLFRGDFFYFRTYEIS